MSYVQRSTMTLTMLVIFVTMVWIASGYPPNSRFMPFVVGIPAIGLCLLQLVLDARARRRETKRLDAQVSFEGAEESVSRMAGRKLDFEVAHERLPVVEPEAELPRSELIRRETVLWVWFTGFIGSILLFGFWLTIPIFLVAFLRFQAGASWRNALLLGLAAAALLIYVFEMVFRLEVHPGFLTEYVREWLQG